MKKILLSLATLAVASSAFAADEVVTLRGDFNSWGSDQVLELKDGVYTTTVERLIPGFKVVVNNGQDNWYGSNDGIELNTPLTVSGDGGNIMFANTQMTAINNCEVTFDLSAMTLTVNGEAEVSETPITPTYWIHGNFAGTDWASTEMTENEGVWSCTIENIDQSGSFGIKEMTGASQTAWFWSKDKTDITGPIENLAVEKEGTEGAAGANWNYTLSGSFEFIFDIENMTLTIKEVGSGAIDAIDVENEVTAVYYNLQGVRINEPANGMFIVKRGNKVTKELVK